MPESAYTIVWVSELNASLRYEKRSMPAIQKTLRRLLGLSRKSSRRAIQRRVTTSLRSSNDLNEDGKLKRKKGKRSSEIKRSDNGPKDAGRTSKTLQKKSEESTTVSTVETETKIVFPLGELLPLPKHHPAETVTAKEKELSPAKQVGSIWEVNWKHCSQ